MVLKTYLFGTGWGEGGFLQQQQVAVDGFMECLRHLFVHQVFSSSRFYYNISSTLPVSLG